MEEFIKESEITEKNEREKNIQLLNSIAKTRQELKKAHINFEFAEEELIDYYVYEIKANQSKLDYLIRLAKAKKLKNDIRYNEEVEGNEVG